MHHGQAIAAEEAAAAAPRSELVAGVHDSFKESVVFVRLKT